MKKLFLIFLFTPLSALAVWYNPFSWFSPSPAPKAGAPTNTFQRTVLPETDNLYDIGHSLRVWKTGYFNELCLAGDCRATFPTGNSYDWTQENNIFSVLSLTPTSTIPIQIKSTATSTFAGGLEAWRQISAPYFHATSSTATSTFAGGIQLGSQVYIGSSGFLSIGSANPTAKFQVDGMFQYIPGYGSLHIGPTNAATTEPDVQGNVYIGGLSGNANLTGDRNVAIGYNTLRYNTAGSDNVALGQQALLNNTGSQNFGLGRDALQKSTSGSGNVAIGYRAGYGLVGTTYTSQSYNVLIGRTSGNNIVSNAQFNTCVGDTTCYGDNLGFSGQRNIAIGVGSGGDIGSGSYNILIGRNVEPPASTTSNYMSIGNVIFSDGVGTVETTGISSGKVGIGTSSPFAKLSVHAFSGQNNLALFAIGSSTASATTTLFEIENTGRVGIGTTSPISTLSVVGQMASSTFYLGSQNRPSCITWYSVPSGNPFREYISDAGSKVIEAGECLGY